MTRPDPLLLELIADVVRDLQDPLPQMALTDYLAERGPTPVSLGDVPRWLQRAWSRSRQAHRPNGPFAGLEVDWCVLRDMEDWLALQGRPRVWALEHHGATTVGGLPCFASEPRAPPEVAQEQARCLAARLKCAAVVIPEGAWGRQVVRLLLLPSPKQQPRPRGHKP
jgi:hypothetical protein